jgi:hypothetical protein
LRCKIFLLVNEHDAEIQSLLNWKTPGWGKKIKSSSGAVSEQLQGSSRQSDASSRQIHLTFLSSFFKKELGAIDFSSCI